MLVLRTLIYKISMITCILSFMCSGIARAENSPMTLALLGASATVGSRGGLGISTGLARASCGSLGCEGYGLVLHNRLGMQYTASLEAGGGFFLMVLPAYAGFGVRAKNGHICGGQGSLGTGLGPVLGLLTIYTENSNVGVEFGISAHLPIPIGSNKF